MQAKCSDVTPYWPWVFAKCGNDTEWGDYTHCFYDWFGSWRLQSTFFDHVQIDESIFISIYFVIYVVARTMKITRSVSMICGGPARLHPQIFVLGSSTTISSDRKTHNLSWFLTKLLIRAVNVKHFQPMASQIDPSFSSPTTTVRILCNNKWNSSHSMILCNHYIMLHLLYVVFFFCV